jgi:hypothetical protein
MLNQIKSSDLIKIYLFIMSDKNLELGNPSYVYIFFNVIKKVLVDIITPPKSGNDINKIYSEPSDNTNSNLGEPLLKK